MTERLESNQRAEIERRLGGVYVLDGSFASLWALEHILVALRRVPSLASQTQWMATYLGDLFERAFRQMGMRTSRPSAGKLSVLEPIEYHIDIQGDLARMIRLDEPFPHFHGLRWIPNSMLGSAMLPWYGLSTVFQNHTWAQTQHDAIGHQRDRMDRAIPWLTRAFVDPLELAPADQELAHRVAQAMVWPPLCYPQNDFGEHNLPRLIDVLQDAPAQQTRDVLDAFIASQDRACQMLAAAVAVHFGVPPETRHEASIYHRAIQCFRISDLPPSMLKSIQRCQPCLESPPCDIGMPEYETLSRLDPSQGLAFGRAMLACDASLPATQCITGWHAERLGRKQEAMEHYTRSIELKPDYAQPLINRGTLYSMDKDHVQGDRDFFAARALRPEDPDLRLNLLLNHLFALDVGQVAHVQTPAPQPNALRTLLAAYREGEVPGSAVVRAMMEHSGYVVPSVLLPPEYVAARGVVFSARQAFTDGALWVFTDEQTAYQAHDCYNALGPYSFDQPASAFLTPEVQRAFSHVCINPFDRPNEFVVLGQNMDALRLWFHGVSVEQAAASSELELLSVLARSHRGFMVALRADGQLHLTHESGALTAHVAATPDQGELLGVDLGYPTLMAPVSALHLRRALINARVERVRIAGVEGDVPASVFGEAPR